MKSILFGSILVLLQASCVSAFAAGTRVLALKDDNKYHPGVIHEVDTDSQTQTVRFDNQQSTVNYPLNTESEVILDQTTPFLDDRAHVIAKKEEQASQWDIGFVVGLVGSGSERQFRVVLDGDATPETYNNSQLRFLANPDSVQTVGARVIAKGPRTASDSYFRGFVVDTEGSSLSIRLDNGNNVEHAKSDTAAVIRDEIPFTTRLTDDKNVIAAVEPDGDEYASAVIRARRSSNEPRYIVRFDDGSQTCPIRDYYHIRSVPEQ
ncbi:hypothetical protein ACROYT_G007476 [Oculina patagonica]